MSISIYEVIEKFHSNNSISSSNSSSGISVLRTFRLLRIIKLIRFLPTLRRQIVIMLKSFNDVASFFLLLGLFIFIFRFNIITLLSTLFFFKIKFISSILGMNLFGCKFYTTNPDGTIEYERKNFDSLLWAFINVFQVS